MQFGNNGNSRVTSNTSSRSAGRQSAQTRSIERAERRLDSSGNAHVIQSIVGQHNYTAAARKPSEKGLMAFLRRKLTPLIMLWDKFHEKARESARFIRRIVNGAFIGGMIIAIVGGYFAKVGISVPNAKVPSTKTFINADTVRLTHETYDPNNHAMELHLKTTGANGAVSASQLTSKLEMAEAPKHHWFSASTQQMPVVTVIPTFNNHFVVLIKHLYHGFDGLDVTLHDRANITPSSINSATNNSDTMSKKLSDKQQEMLEKVAQQGVTNYRHGQESQRLIHKIEKANNAGFVVREQTAKADHKGYVNPDESSEQIAMNALRKHLKFDYKTISSNNRLIKQEKNHMKADNRQIRTINKNADVGGKQADLSKIREDIQNSMEQLKQYKQTDAKLQKDVNTTLSLISRVNVHIAQIPPRRGKVKASIFHPDD